MLQEFLDGRVLVKVGDITEENVDAIVNAANWTVLGGGGVDGAIHDKGGHEIYDQWRKIRDEQFPKGLPTGEAVITSGGDLPARHVIHTVGPIFGRNNGRDAELLADCYIKSLALAAANRITSVAFPSISTGAFGYPKYEAAKISSAAVREAIARHISITEVRLVFFAPSDAKIFLKHCIF